MDVGEIAYLLVHTCGYNPWYSYTCCCQRIEQLVPLLAFFFSATRWKYVES
jgi:hypothetical protein